jgi:uncharacterized protein (TIGR00375 family)
MNIESLYVGAQIKGITVLGTGDFTHPGWFKELQDKLEPDQEGLLKLKSEFKNKLIPDIPPLCRAEVRFVPTAEISCIYSKNNRTRKVHNLIIAPNFSAVSKINSKLQNIGNLTADGRPILGLDSKDLLKIVIDASPECLFVPAHAWTPHFSVFGSESGFDSLEECFEELSRYIYAIETGLSSDPPMNWRLSMLDNISLISNSDAHSPGKLAREGNVFNVKLNYKEIIKAIKSRKGFLGTIEFFPEEGKYHFDGHRNCGICLSPEETKKNKDLCPKCGKKLTIGVMYRVAKLADRKKGFKPDSTLPYKSLIPLPEIISDVLGVGVNSKKVQGEYKRLLEILGNEMYILQNISLDEIAKTAPSLMVEAIRKVREGKVEIYPGYDGEYGKIKVVDDKEREELDEQLSLF